MQWYEILIIVGACAFVVGVVLWRVIRRLHGKTGCDDCGACSACHGCSACREKEKKQ